MAIGRILIPLYEYPFDNRLLDMAQQIVKSNRGCLQVVYFRPEPVDELVFGSEIAATPDTSEQALEQAASAMAAIIRLGLEHWAAEHGYVVTPEHDPTISFQVSFMEQIGDPTEALTRLGRLSDLIICFKPSRDLDSSQQIFDTALSATGRLTLVVPKDPPREILQHVLIAWDGSLQISHVLGQATSFLRSAGRISIFCYPDANCDSSGLDQLVQYLACHGVTAHRVETRRTKPIGEALTEAAVTQRVSVIAMGAYGHSRAREFLLGGLTRYMLKHTTLPLLMTH
jgi:nucleotide-binding universal stress UspA family protein